jgi:hypothetical protein
VLVRTLEPQLRANAAASFAGVARSGDGTLDIYVVGIDSAGVSTIVARAQAALGEHVPVRLITGQQHSLAELNALQSQVTAAQPRLKADGIVLTEWAVNIRANKVHIGILNLDDATRTRLGQEFGADRIELVPGGYYRVAVDDRACRSWQWASGI